jgi:hypothetical protein
LIQPKRWHLSLSKAGRYWLLRLILPLREGSHVPPHPAAVALPKEVDQRPLCLAGESVIVLFVSLELLLKSGLGFNQKKTRHDWITARFTANPDTELRRE